MSRPTKIAIYAGLITCAVIFAAYFGMDLNQVIHGTGGGSKPRMIASFGAFLAVAVVLGILGAQDVSRRLGKRTESWILQSGDPALSAAELDKAENLRKRGEPLEAVRLLRDFLQKYPGEYEVMSRIAEIYNYDLKNYLAAALEYEELLQRKLPDEDWGWAALHLAKLYGRLNQPDKAVELLERLDGEYGHTLAAKRARKVREQHSSESDEEPPPADSP